MRLSRFYFVPIFFLSIASDSGAAVVAVLFSCVCVCIFFFASFDFESIEKCYLIIHFFYFIYLCLLYATIGFLFCLVVAFWNVEVKNLYTVR